jgi:HlyD family secretion protein
MKKFITWIVVIIAIAIIGYFAVTFFRQRQQTETTNEYQTVVVSLGNQTSTVGATGTVRTENEASLVWGTSGIVDSVNFAVGDQVEKGQVLAFLEDGSLPQNIISAQMELLNAQIALDDLYDNWELNLAQAALAVEDAEEALDDIQISELEQSQTQLALLKAQEKLDDAIEDRERLDYQRCLDSTIQSYEAQYYMALNKYEMLDEAYRREYAPLPSNDPERLNALATLLAAEEEVQKALINLNWCLGNYTEEEIAEADANVQLAEAELKDAEEAYERSFTGMSAAEIAVLEVQLVTAQQQWERIKNGPDPNNIATLEARIASAEATLKSIQIEAPFDGTITIVETKPGSLVSAGTYAFRLDDTSRLLVDTQVSEVDINFIHPGQPVNMTFDAVQDKEYRGVVVEVSPVGSTVQGVVEFTVTIELIDPDEDSKPGMTSAVNIIVDELLDVLLVPNRAIRVVDGQRVVYILADGELKQIPVVMGATSDTTSEIIGGVLQSGDVVVLNPPSNIFDENGPPGFMR